MSQKRARAVPVTDSDGLRGVFDSSAEFADERGAAQVLVRLEDGRRAVVPVDELVLQPDGSCTFPHSLAGLARRGADAAGPRRPEEDDRVVIPVVAEQLDIRKRKIEAGGYRISKTVTEREEVVDEPLMREEVHVKRVEVNRVVDGPVPVRHVGDTMIIPLLEEVLVVEKRLMLKEELHVTKAGFETYRPQRVTLRSEEARVERVEGENRMPDRSEHDDAPGGMTAAGNETTMGGGAGETATIVTPRHDGGDTFRHDT